MWFFAFLILPRTFHAHHAGETWKMDIRIRKVIDLDENPRCKLLILFDRFVNYLSPSFDRRSMAFAESFPIGSQCRTMVLKCK